MLGEAKVQVSRTVFDDAELTLDEANSRILGLETGLQELSQSRLAEAEEAYKEAVDAESQEYAGDLLNDTAKVMDDARSAAAQGQWKEAIQSGDEALTLAGMDSLEELTGDLDVTPVDVNLYPDEHLSIPSGHLDFGQMVYILQFDEGYQATMVVSVLDHKIGWVPNNYVILAD